MRIVTREQFEALDGLTLEERLRLILPPEQAEREIERARTAMMDRFTRWPPEAEAATAIPEGLVSEEKDV